MAMEFIEQEKGERQTQDQLKCLTVYSKRLKSLRDKRDQLRAELEATEERIRDTALEIGKFTAALADVDAGPHKRRNGKE